MNGDVEDFPRWRDSVESRLGTLETAAWRQEAALKTQADLRAAMDKDMGTLSAKLGAQGKLIQAIAKTQSDHTRRLRTIDGRLGQVEGRLGQVEGKLDLVHVGVQAIHALLTGLAADDTHKDDPVSANPVDADPDALPGIRGECR
jgi:hypothetical protein